MMNKSKKPRKLALTQISAIISNPVVARILCQYKNTMPLLINSLCGDFTCSIKINRINDDNQITLCMQIFYRTIFISTKIDFSQKSLFRIVEHMDFVGFHHFVAVTLRIDNAHNCYLLHGLYNYFYRIGKRQQNLDTFTWLQSDTSLQYFHVLVFYCDEAQSFQMVETITFGYVDILIVFLMRGIILQDLFSTT